MSLLARLTARADADDAYAIARRLVVVPTGRHGAGRAGRDPRMDGLGAARAAGCGHAPVHLDTARCPTVRHAVRAA